MASEHKKVFILTIPKIISAIAALVIAVTGFIKYKNHWGKTDKVNYIVVAKKAFFYDAPNPKTKRNAYLLQSNKVIALDEINGYVFTEYRNDEGTLSQGWIFKSDLSLTP